MKQILLLIFVILFPVLAIAADYDRESFKHWSDLDGDGLSTREEILERDFTTISGVTFLVCPYTGKVITETSKVDVDHVVPLSYAWRNGAANWDAAKKEQFANDPDNLLAVDASANRIKKDSSPSKWVPSVLSFVPIYNEMFYTICRNYNLDCSE